MTGDHLNRTGTLEPYHPEGRQSGHIYRKTSATRVRLILQGSSAP